MISGHRLPTYANAPSLQVATFSSDPNMRSQGTIALWNTYLFGHRSFRAHGEFTAFLDGFNLNSALLQVCYLVVPVLGFTLTC
jgi:hypothetical protein